MESSNNSHVAGYILIVIGGFIALFLANEIYRLYLNPESSNFINHIVTKLTKTELFKINNNPIVLGQGSAYSLAVFFLFLFSWVAVAIAFNFVKYGVYIISPKTDKELESLKSQLNESQKKLEEWTSNKAM